jgi:hypothetical protein
MSTLERIGRMPAEKVEGGRTLQQGDLDRLGEPRAKIPVRETGDQALVVHHAPRHGERPLPVLLAEGVDRILDADAGVGLGERRRRESHEPDPAMRDGGGVANRVEQRTAADDEHERTAIEAVPLNRPEHVIDGLVVVLRLLATVEALDRRHEFDPRPLLGEPGGEVSQEPRIGIGHGPIDPHLHAGRAVVALKPRRDQVPVGPETVAGEPQPQRLGDAETDVVGILGDRPGDGRHDTRDPRRGMTGHDRTDGPVSCPD